MQHIFYKNFERKKKSGEDNIFFLNTIQGKACFDFPKKFQNEEKFTTLNRQM